MKLYQEIYLQWKSLQKDKNAEVIIRDVRKTTLTTNVNKNICKTIRVKNAN